MTVPTTDARCPTCGRVVKACKRRRVLLSHTANGGRRCAGSGTRVALSNLITKTGTQG